MSDPGNDLYTQTQDSRARKMMVIKQLAVAARLELNKNHITLDAQNIIPESFRNDLWPHVHKKPYTAAVMQRRRNT